MEQTAVEWLIEQLDNNLDIKHSWRTRQYIQQAKEMEKQQIINTSNETCLNINELVYRGLKHKKVLSVGEEYYNQTFKSE